eukprot:5014223-Pyramimonas_sp.AAC.1
MERITSCLEEIVCDLNSLDKGATASLKHIVQPWTVPYCMPTRVAECHYIVFVQTGWIKDDGWP